MDSSSGLVEQLARAGVAAPSTHAAERDQRADPADRVARLRKHVLGGRGGLVPAAGVRLDQREPRARVVRPEVVLVGVGDVLVQVTTAPICSTCMHSRRS